MARVSAAETLAALKSKTPPKLTIIGSAQATRGRVHAMMKIRPSTLKRLQAVALGPTYLLLEHALLRLVEDLERMPDGHITTVDAASFNPSDEDVAVVEEAKKRTKENPGEYVNRQRKKDDAKRFSD